MSEKSRKILLITVFVVTFPIGLIIYFIVRYCRSEEKDLTVVALQNAAKRAAWGYSGAGSSGSSKQETRVKLKDGKELHTEQRFGDYKTYLYDSDGKNTGLHISGDKVYDDSWNEQGHFNGSGDFIKKN